MLMMIPFLILVSKLLFPGTNYLNKTKKSIKRVIKINLENTIFCMKNTFYFQIKKRL